MLVEEFKLALHDLNRPIDDEMRDYYRTSISPSRKELIKQYKKELKDYLNQCVEDCLDSPDFNLDTVRSTVEDLLIKISDLGDSSPISRYHYKLKNPYKSVYIEKVWKDTLSRFQNGDPLSFNLIADFLGGCLASYGPQEKVLEINITSETNSSIEGRLKWLERLAELGVKRARHDLAFIYYNKEFGDRREFKVKYTNDERYQGLMKLSLLGSKWAQYELGLSLYHKKKFIREKDDQWIKEQFQELIELETLGIKSKKSPLTERDFNYYVTAYYASPPKGLVSMVPDRLITLISGDILTLTQRLSILEERARKGDSHSYKELIEAYQENNLGGVSLGVSSGERWRRLLELKEIDPPKWNLYLHEALVPELLPGKEDKLKIPISFKDRFRYILDQAENTGWLIEKIFSRTDINLELDLSPQEKFQILLRIATEFRNTRDEILTRCLIYNHYHTYKHSPERHLNKLDLTPQERLKHLIFLIEDGTHEAMWKVSNIILGKMGRLIKPVQEEVQALKSVINEEEIAELILLNTWNDNLYKPLIYRFFPDKEEELIEVMKMKYSAVW